MHYRIASFSTAQNQCNKLPAVVFRGFRARVADAPSRQRLGSASSSRPTAPSFRLITVGGRALPVSGATVASALSLSLFSQHLK